MQALRGIRSTTLTLVVLVVMVGCDVKETSQPAVANVAGDDQPAGLRVQLSEPSDDKAAGVELIGLSPKVSCEHLPRLTTPRVRAAAAGARR